MAGIIRRASFRIVIRRVEPPYEKSVERDLEWIGQSLGLSSLDRDKTTMDVFKLVVRATEEGKGISSSEIAQKINLSRGAVIHHLNNLQAAGLVVRQGRAYLSRSRSMVRTIQEVEEDIKRIFDRMEETAKEIDRAFGLDLENRSLPKPKSVKRQSQSVGTAAVKQK